MRSLSSILSLFLSLALLVGCNKATDPDTPSDTTPGEVTVTRLTDLPTIGGNATGVAVTSSGMVVAVIDGRLHSIDAAGVPQPINGDVGLTIVGAAPSGELYTLTATEFRAYNSGGGAPKIAPIPPSGPLAVNGRVEDAWIKFSPTGEPFITIVSNYPRTYTYYSTDKGTTWNALKFSGGAEVMSYVGDIAFTASGDIIAGDYAGLFKTTDRGETWTKLTGQMPNAAVKLLVASNGDIYRYIPGGGNLSVSHTGGTNFTDLTQTNKPPFFTNIQQGADGALYALANRSAVGGGLPINRPMSLVRSTDGGTTWNHLLFCQGYDVAVSGSTIAVALAAMWGGVDMDPGGVCISRNSGATWISAGLRPVETFQDFGFDKNGNLMLLAHAGLFRRASSGWQTLGSQPSAFVRFATTPHGGLLLAGTASAFHSSDDGMTWTERPLEYTYAGLGRLALPVLLGRNNGEFMVSMTTYRDDLGQHTNGALYRVGLDGNPQRITQGGHTFTSMVEDRSGMLYGGEEALDPISVTLSVRRYTSGDGGVTWQQSLVKSPGLAFNSGGKSFQIAGNGSYVLGAPGSDATTKFTLKGFTSLPQYITSARFDASDRLYLLTLDQGIFSSVSALK